MKSLTKLSAALAVVLTLSACCVPGPHGGHHQGDGPGNGPRGGEMQAPRGR